MIVTMNRKEKIKLLASAYVPAEKVPAKAIDEIYSWENAISFLFLFPLNIILCLLFNWIISMLGVGLTPRVLFLALMFVALSYAIHNMQAFFEKRITRKVLHRHIPEVCGWCGYLRNTPRSKCPECGEHT